MIGDEPIIEKIKCSVCDFTDEFEPDCFGLTYYQSVGFCPHCDNPMVYDDGIGETETREIKTLKYE